MKDAVAKEKASIRFASIRSKRGDREEIERREQRLASVRKKASSVRPWGREIRDI